MADSLIPFLLGPQWAPSAPIFMALGFAGLVQPLNTPAGWLFISQGRSTDYMIWGLVTAAMAATAFAAGLAWGAVGVATAYAISEYLKTPALWLFVSRKGPVRWGDILTTCGPALVAAYVALAGVHLVHDRLAADGALGLVAGAALSYVLFTGALALFPAGRATLREALGIALRPASLVGGAP